MTSVRLLGMVVIDNVDGYKEDEQGHIKDDPSLKLCVLACYPLF